MSETNERRSYRPRSLQRMFQSVSKDYDLLNHVLTFGLDHRWRKRAASSCLENSPSAILDLCCGTGDLLLTMTEKNHGETKTVGVDFTDSMIEIAHLRTGKLCPLVIADAGQLPFAGESFDCVATAFSFRNLLYKNPGLQGYLTEVLRILKQDGRFLILETSQPRKEIIRRIYHGYLRNIVPFIGGLVSGSRGAYMYLGKSALSFPAPQDIEELLRTAGFREVAFQPLLLGIVGIHIAVK